MVRNLSISIPDGPNIAQAWNGRTWSALGNALYRFFTRCLLLMLFTTSLTFEINKLQQIQNASTMWFESMPGSHVPKGNFPLPNFVDAIAL